MSLRFYAILLIILCISACERASGVANDNSSIYPEKVVILDSLRHPWSLAFLSETDVLITEKDGHLLRVNLHNLSKTVIKGAPEDLVDSIRVKDFRDNSGLFEVLLHPEFDQNHWIYLSYAAESEDGTTTKVIRAELRADSLAEVQTIFVADPYRFDLFHYGGGMTFGPDGALYLTIGERYYNEMDQPALPIAQNINDKRGKIHRLHADGSVPDDNPDFGEDAIPSLFALGIRAAQGITMNPQSGDIWFTEHGSVQGDEINLLLPGANYGWPIKTSGKYRNQAYLPPDLHVEHYTDPVHFWQQTIAPTGLTFYYGSAFPSWRGNILLAGLSQGSLWRMVLEDKKVVSVEELFINDRVRARKVMTSPDGKLFILTDEANGKLIEIRNGASR